MFSSVYDNLKLRIFVFALPLKGILHLQREHVLFQSLQCSTTMFLQKLRTDKTLALLHFWHFWAATKEKEWGCNLQPHHYMPFISYKLLL